MFHLIIHLLKRTHLQLNISKYYTLLYKQWKQGFNTSWLKYYHIHLAGVWTVLLGAVSVYVFWNKSAGDILRDKVGKYPALQ